MENIPVNGGRIRFRNRRCHYGLKAAVKISDSPDNPRKLYFHCPTRECHYYYWWDPGAEEFNPLVNIQCGCDRAAITNIQNEVQVVRARVNVLESLCSRIEKASQWVLKVMLVGMIFVMVIAMHEVLGFD